MYPTRTTSTTGTFQIPPHPTPLPADRDPDPAPRAAAEPTPPEPTVTGPAATGPTTSAWSAQAAQAAPAAPVESAPAASAPPVPERAEGDWAVPVPAVAAAAAAPVAVPVAAEWAATAHPEPVATVPAPVGAAASAAPVTEWAGTTGWAVAPERERPVPAAAAAVVSEGADRAPYGRAAGGEAARSDVPAARVQADPGAQAPAGPATLRLRSQASEAARPHPQDDPWPPTSASAGVAPAETAAVRGGHPADPEPAGPAEAEHGSACAVAEVRAGAQDGPFAPEPAAAGPVACAVRDVPEQGPAHRPGVPGPAAEAEPEASAAGRDLTWSVPVPAPAPAGAADEPAPAPVPGVVEVVARAVARMAEDDTQDLPHVGSPRGVAVTEVPVHLPFRGAAQPQQSQQSRQAHQASPPKRSEQPQVPKAAAARSAPGRRVPRGDDRLHEHRGPVLPGWIGVAVGGLALTGCAVVLWRAGAVPDALAVAFGAEPRPYRGLQARFWPPLAFLGVVVLLALGGLGRGRAGHAWVLTLFGRYRGTVRRSGLTWISPLLLRRRVDVRLRHWRSDPMPAVDSGGLALQVVVQVVWQVKDTARATLAVADHVDYLAEQVESAMARVLSQLPADAFHEDAPTLRDAEAVGDALTRMLAAETEAVGVEVFSAQPTRIEYAPEVADAMRRRRVAAIDAKHRDTVLTSVVDAVDDTVHRLTSRGLVELDDYERKALVKDLTVAFYTGRAE